MSVFAPTGDYIRSLSDADAPVLYRLKRTYMYILLAVDRDYSQSQVLCIFTKHPTHVHRTYDNTIPHVGICTRRKNYHKNKISLALAT